ncbi:hypothetical protein [Ornithinimicrobium tianjinense]|uniref:hypothetical protein n=1 Tax=Ornithinimicrobium tianjinense TaxID=1195761 RepID=UPI001662A224|nr:hypothetical protein [Ornithinimicrobium tianjinense]
MHLQRGASYAALAARLGGGDPSDAAEVTTAPATEQRDCPGLTPGEVLTAQEAQQRAEACDRTHVLATPQPEQLLPTLAKGWASATKNVLTPLATLLLPAAIVALAILVAARLLVPLVPRWPRIDHLRSRRLVTWGVASVLAASACLVIGLAGGPQWLVVALGVSTAAVLVITALTVQGTFASQTAFLITVVALLGGVVALAVLDVRIGRPALLLVGVAAAVCAAALVALEMATRLRLSISVRDAEGGVRESELTHLVALLEEMGGDGPRGLEVPRGADVTALTDSVITTDPTGKVLKALWAAWKLLVGPIPWLVVVDQDDQDRSTW